MAKYEFRKTFTFEGRRFDVKAHSQEELYERVAEIKGALKRGEVPIGENMTVKQWFSEWKSLYKEPSGITKKSLGAYDEKFKYLAAIENMKLREVRDIHLQRILNKEAGRSYSHVTKLRGLMREMFGQARRSRLISFDPAEDLKLPETEKRSHRSLTDDERMAVLRVAEVHPSGLWILTLLYTGMRPGETAALQWMDVDFEANEIHVRAALESGTGERKGPKTAAGNRDIPIHPKLRARLLTARGGPFQPVFPTGAGNFQNDNSLRRLWTSFRRALDIELGAECYRNKIVQSVIAQDLTPYCLRHTFCTDLQRAGVPVNVAKDLMGHSDISITANIYTHKDQKTLHENMEKLFGVETSVEKSISSL